MNHYTIERLNEFSSLIAPFKGIWRTVLLRAAWFEAEGAPRLLTLSIRLEPGMPAQYKKAAASPEAGPYKIAYEALPIARLDGIFAQLTEGRITVQGTALALEHKGSNIWQGVSSPFVSVDCPGVYVSADQKTLEIYLHGSDSQSDKVYEPVSERFLTPLWRALPAPYWDRADVFRNFFEISRSPDQNQVYVYAGGTVPITFTHETRVEVDKLHLGISIPKGALPKKISVGMIASRHDGKIDHRMEIPTATGWKKKGFGWIFSKVIPLPEHFQKVVLLLRYGGALTERLGLVPIGTPTSNAAVVAQAALDPSEEFYLQGLSGQGGDPGRDFEKAISFLMSFCGFAVLPYGDINRFKESAPDILATSTRENVILAIECTISSPNTNGKLNKLQERCRRMRSHLKGQRIIPVLATSIPRARIPPSEASMAIQDRIALLSAETLFELNGLAVRSRPTAEILRFIEQQRGPEPNGLFGVREDF